MSKITEDIMILTILLIFFCIRLISLKISMQHAKQLKADGAVEYGIKNSKFLVINSRIDLH